LNRCGDIAKACSDASRLPKGDMLVQPEARLAPETLRVEPILVLEYLAAQIGHPSSIERTAK